MNTTVYEIKFHNGIEFVPVEVDQFVMLQEDERYAFIEQVESLYTYNVLLEPISKGGGFVPAYKTFIPLLNKHVAIYERYQDEDYEGYKNDED